MLGKEEIHEVQQRHPHMRRNSCMYQYKLRVDLLEISTAEKVLVDNK